MRTEIGLLRTMLLIRRLEAAWAEAYARDEIGGIPPALSTGQEAVSAGACAALEPGGIVAAQVPVAAGMALAQKLRGTDRVSLVFFGDGAANEGAVHESANLAAMWTLPLILLCENNGYCISQPVAVAVKAASIADRAAAYGLPGALVDGNDPLAVRDAVAAAVARARAGGGTTLVEARTVRLGGHLAHDPQHYRSREEIAAAWEACPIKRFRARLAAAGLLTEEASARMEAEVEAEIAAAVEFARQSPVPEPREAFEDLW